MTLSTPADVVAELDATTDPVARAVLDLHRRVPESWLVDGRRADGWRCVQCPDDRWPCETTTVVAMGLGLIPPDDTTWAPAAYRLERPADGSLDQP